MNKRCCEHCSAITTYVIREDLFTEEFEIANDNTFNKLYREAKIIENIKK